MIPLNATMCTERPACAAIVPGALVGLCGALLLACGVALAGSGPLDVAGAGLGPSDVERLAGLGFVLLGTGVLIWWLFCLLAGLGAELLRRWGHVSAANRAARLSPAFMRRLAAALIGAHLLVLPAAQAAIPGAVDGPGALPAAVGAAPPPATWNAAIIPAPSWKPDDATPVKTGAVHAREQDAIAGGSGTATAFQRELDPDRVPSPGWTAERPAAPMNRLMGQQNRAATDTDGVVVTDGDSLWSIAARSIGPGATDAEIAQEWPRWYRANRRAIGPDPDLLHIGTILTRPRA